MTNDRRSQRSALTQERIAFYRRHAVPADINAMIKELNACSIDHELLRALGNETLSMAAERAWLETAIVLSATPAQTVCEARWKVTYLETCLHQWVLPTAKDRHEREAGMILGAITLEKLRWHEAAADSHPN